MANSIGNVTCFLCLQVENSAGLLPLGLWSQQSVVLVTMVLHMEVEADRGFQKR